MSKHFEKLVNFHMCLAWLANLYLLLNCPVEWGTTQACIMIKTRQA